MNVRTLEMPKWEAREKLKAVRAQLHRRADAEYQQLESAYSAAARGLRLLSLSDAFTSCPLDEANRPRIAIARADQRQVCLWGEVSKTERFMFDCAPSRWGRVQQSLRIAAVHRRGPSTHIQGYSLVPMIPPEHRKNHALDAHFILWEVERWADKPVVAIPDRDPYLLRHIGADLYAIVAEWDLTDIERMVMAGRARA